jgi:hypothetical protein
VLKARVKPFINGQPAALYLGSPLAVFNVVVGASLVEFPPGTAEQREPLASKSRGDKVLAWSVADLRLAII